MPNSCSKLKCRNHVTVGHHLCEAHRVPAVLESARHVDGGRKAVRSQLPAVDDNGHSFACPGFGTISKGRNPFCMIEAQLIFGGFSFCRFLYDHQDPRAAVEARVDFIVPSEGAGNSFQNCTAERCPVTKKMVMRLLFLVRNCHASIAALREHLKEMPRDSWAVTHGVHTSGREQQAQPTGEAALTHANNDDVYPHITIRIGERTTVHVYLTLWNRTLSLTIGDKQYIPQWATVKEASKSTFFASSCPNRKRSKGRCSTTWLDDVLDDDGDESSSSQWWWYNIDGICFQAKALKSDAGLDKLLAAQWEEDDVVSPTWCTFADRCCDATCQDLHPSDAELAAEVRALLGDKMQRVRVSELRVEPPQCQLPAPLVTDATFPSLPETAAAAAAQAAGDHVGLQPKRLPVLPGTDDDVVVRLPIPVKLKTYASAVAPRARPILTWAAHLAPLSGTPPTPPDPLNASYASVVTQLSPTKPLKSRR